MDSIVPSPMRRIRSREIVVVGDIAIVPLTRGYEAIIDADDYGKIAGRNWFAVPQADGRVAAATSVKRNGKTTTYYMHRVILHINGDLPVDHADGNALNNRKGNLRECTYSQNTANRHAPTTSNSGYKGVWYDKERQKYVANIGVNRVRRHIGRYDTAQEAAAAYDLEAKKAFGEFARTNQSIQEAC